MFLTFTQYEGLKGTNWPWGLGVMWFALIAGGSHVHLSRSWPCFAERWGVKVRAQWTRLQQWLGGGDAGR